MHKVLDISICTNHVLNFMPGLNLISQYPIPKLSPPKQSSTMASGYGLAGGKSSPRPIAAAHSTKSGISLLQSYPQSTNPIPPTTFLPSPNSRRETELIFMLFYRDRPLPLLPLLARSARLLRLQHELRRRLWQSEVCARARGLLRVSASQERGVIPPRHSVALL